jgi:hypothetical protein
VSPANAFAATLALLVWLLVAAVLVVEYGFIF